MRIGAIVQANQPNIHRELNKKQNRDRKKRRDNQHLSFSNIDRLMRERADVDERKCNGR